MGNPMNDGKLNIFDTTVYLMVHGFVGLVSELLLVRIFLQLSDLGE